MSNQRKNRKRVAQSFEGQKSMTIQSDRTRSDIESILNQGIAAVDPRQMSFFDVSDMPDFRGVRDAINSAYNSFDNLPAKVRKEFENDPANLIDALADPEQNDRMIELGIRERVDESPVVSDEPVKGAPVAAPEKGSREPKEGGS